ncbi:MAG: HEPN domain-containing protein [Nostoc sp.]|uniref:HEPN domain-containing protein n=1 Tax=Nostoc sp. TaxID=1180 RepID=UPI002FFB0627
MTNLDPLALEIIDELLANTGSDVASDLMDDEKITGLISISGSTGWGFETYQIAESWFIEPKKISFYADIYLDATPDDETSILGTSIVAEIHGKALKEDENWEISEYEIVEADFYPPNDYDEYYSSIILSNTDFHKTFQKDLEKIEALLNAEVTANKLEPLHQMRTLDKDEVQQYLFRLLYINVITALETFLSDAFINTVLKDRVLIRKFVESNPDFAKHKFSLKELFFKLDKIDEEVKKYLSSQLWHNLKKVKPMYKDTFNIEFPKDLKELFKAIEKRHHFVHRNGKSKNGEEITLTQKNIEELVVEARKLVDHIDKQFGNNNIIKNNNINGFDF